MEKSKNFSFQKENNEKNEEFKQNAIEEKLGGIISENDGGDFYKREIKYSLDRRHGLYNFNQLFEFGHSEITEILKDNPSNINENIFKDTLFIDTETTGLMGGTGTLPFMIGAGFFENNKFIVRQYFMRDYDDEYALLLDLKELFNSHNNIFSFNGKSFDLPILQTRFVLNRLEKIDIDYHFDLLYMARRVWKHLSSCSLENLEAEILEIKRNNDIPGEEIPKIFFKYLRTKDPKLIAPIFKHNLIDIVSLLTLLIHLLKVYNKNKECQLSVNELYNLGIQFEKRKEIEKSIEILERAKKKVNKKENNYKLNEDIAVKLSWQYKRNDDWEKAVSIWENMIKINSGKLFPYLELAKYYEHIAKDFKIALKYVKIAKDLLRDKRVFFDNYQKKREELNHRLDRLKKKLNKGVFKDEKRHK